MPGVPTPGFAVGSLAPTARFRGESKPPTSMEELLELLLEAEEALVKRLAPPIQDAVIIFGGVAAGAKGSTGILTLSNRYNVVLNCLLSGTVNMWFGNSVGSIPDLQLNPVANPLPIPVGVRDDDALAYQVDPATANPVQGKIRILSY